jgi:transcriptional regulator with XRE-family HTH domain
MPRTPEKTVKKIVELRKKKISLSEISSRLGVSKPTIIKFTREAGVEVNKKRTERSLVLPSQVYDALYKYFKTHKAKNLGDGREYLKRKFNISVTKMTVRNYLRRMKLFCRVKVKKPFLEERHIVARQQFLETHYGWGYEKWRRVWWSDESRYCLKNSNNREFCWVKRCIPLNKHMIKGTTKFDGGGITGFCN